MMQQPLARFGLSLPRTAVLLLGIAFGFFSALALPNTYRVHSFAGTVTMLTENGATCITPSSSFHAWALVYLIELADNPDGTVCAAAPLDRTDQPVMVGTPVQAGISWLPIRTDSTAKSFVFVYPESP